MATGTLLYESVFRRWAVASLRAPEIKHSIMHVAAVLNWLHAENRMLIS
jgi:hypothetical protein